MFWRKKKNLENIRQAWGKHVTKHRNFDLISSYNSLVSNDDSIHNVDKKTWDDLNFDSIFSVMDRNISAVGQQYLYHLLHKYEQDENVLKKRYKLISNLKEKSDIREKIQLKLLNLKGVSSYYVSYLILSKSIPQTRFYHIFYLLSLASLLSLLLIPFNGIFLFVFIGIILTNLFINRIFSKKIYEYFVGFSGLNSLLLSAMLISAIDSKDHIEEIEFLKSKKSLLKSLKKKLSYLVIDKQYLNEFALAFIEYMNMFMLFDIIAYYRSVNILLKHQAEIHDIFKAVGNLDASISVASYLDEIKVFSNPQFNNSNSISFKDLYHPLIKNAIPNSLDEINRSVLITGSNMSGKTTFIKTVGVNFILAQTLYLSLSKSCNIPKYTVKTSIRRNEDIEEGKSYFFAEIEALKNFIDLIEDKNQYLFLIDEIFRGTNTIERLASSTAVLKYLAKDNRVLVTTHDIELQELLQNTFKMFHFSEQVENEKFFFNYKIKQGPCSSGNAIKLLEIMSYPESIISEANSVVKNLLKFPL